ncbi:MAG: helix-turn-helix domain-containing protein [Candidatus Omnitrophota bacterium]
MNSEVLTFEEARKYLKISNSTLYRLVQKRKVPASKVGRSWRFRKERLIAWLDKQERKGKYS